MTHPHILHISVGKDRFLMYKFVTCFGVQGNWIFLLNCSSLHKIKYWLRSSSLQYGRTMQIQDLNFNIQSVLCNSCWHLSHSCLAVTVKDVMSHHCFYCVGMEVFCSLSGHCCVCQKRKWIQTGKLSVHILNAGELIYCLRTGLMKLTV